MFHQRRAKMMIQKVTNGKQDQTLVKSMDTITIEMIDQIIGRTKRRAVIQNHKKMSR